LEIDGPAGAGCDVAGAAFLRAVAHRFGPRGATTTVRQGIGAASVDAAGHALVARALLGAPTPLPTRAGEAVVEVGASVDAALPADLDRQALEATLATAGARLTAWPTVGPTGQGGWWGRVEAPTKGI